MTPAGGRAFTLQEAFTGSGALQAPGRALLAARLGVGLGSRHGGSGHELADECERLAGAAVGEIGDPARRRQLRSWLQAALAEGFDRSQVSAQRLGDLLPGARLLPDGGLDPDQMDSRVRRLLRGCGVRRWSELLERPVVDLASLRDFGPVAFAGLLGACFERSLEGLVDDQRADANDDLGALLLAERRWARQPVLESLLETRASATGEGDGPQQRDAAAAADRLLRRSAPWALDLQPLARLLDSIADELDRAIFVRTELAGSDRTSLAQLAPHYGVSATRLAQRRDRAARQLREALDTAPAPLPWLVSHVRRALGRVTTVAEAHVELARLGVDTSAEPDTALVLWLAGPFEEVPGNPDWLAVGPRELEAVTDELLSGDGGVTSLVQLEHALHAAGLARPTIVPWLRAWGAVVVDGDLAVRISAGVAGTLADTVERLLEALGRPASIADLERLLADGGRPVPPGELERALRGRRFRASDAKGGGRYELASWPRDGAPAKAAARRRPLGQRSAPAAATMPTGAEPTADEAYDGQLALPGIPDARSSAAADMPTASPVLRTGQAERRADGEPEALGQPGTAGLEVPVDDDLLRGGEAPVPPSLVEALGIGYRQRRTFASRYGPVALANDGQGAVRGPLRPVALAAGARRGDVMLLRFEHGGSVSVDILAATDADHDHGAPAEEVVSRHAARHHHPIVHEAGEAT